MKSYDFYFKSGFYDKRYPGPNATISDRIISCVKSGKDAILDYGCGNGRYLIPLSRLENVSSLIGFDISQTALAILEERLNKTAEKKCRDIHLTRDFNDVIGRANRGKKINLALILFGVYSCVLDKNERMRILREIIGVMDPENNRLILSVPNRYRRFWLSQLKNRGSSLGYQRKYHGQTLRFQYKLFTKKEIENELKEAGFTVLNIERQSVLSECQVTSSPLFARIDKTLRAILPVTMAYDYLAEATCIQ